MSSFLNFLVHTSRDAYNLVFPVRNAKELYAFAFLVHPRDERDMVRRFAFLAKAPKWVRKGIQHYFWPVTVSKITGLISNIENAEVPGFVISIPMTADEMLKHRERAKKQIVRATRLARNKGAKIVGLGALTSSLSRGGLDLLGVPGIAVTTGHAYTGHTVTETLLRQLRNAQVSLDTCPIAIVGAAGSVGSISAEILVQAGITTLYLVDIDRKMDAVKDLTDRLTATHSNISIDYGSDMAVLKKAVGIITATNTPDALVKDIHVSPGTILVDDAQPSDISPELYDKDDVVVLEAGAVRTPNISSNFNMGLANRNDNFCCLAEVLILASNKHVHNFVINRATLKDVDHIKKGGDALGFTLADPQNEHGLVAPEKIAHVATLLRARCTS